jgi:hypothetical protein
MKKIIKILIIFLILISCFQINVYANDTSDINNTQNINEFTYRLFYLGRITNLERNEDIVTFDAINLYRISRIRSSDGSYWEFSINHYENVHHSLNDFRFLGIMTNTFIIGSFYKKS